jgi:superfamily I DNA/RNA helicase
MIAEEITRPSLYIAFNKAIADEAKTKFPGHVECRTLHSIAYETIVIGNKNYQKRLKGSLDSREILKLLETSLVGRDYKGRLKIVRRVRKAITEFCQSAEKDIYPIANRTFKADIVNELRLKIGYDNISWDFVEEEVAELAPLATKVWNSLVDTNGTMTLSHDIYLKLYHLGNPTIHHKFKTIYLDEAQDSNDITLDIVLGCARKGSQIILVGDTYQSIYAWRGAVNAFGKIPADFERLSLTTSFRFHSGIAKVANVILDQLGSKEEVIGAAPQIDDYIREDKAILCRTNAGVLQEVIKAASRGEKVYCTNDFSSFFSALWHTVFLKAGKEIKYPYAPFSDYETWDMFEKAAAELDDEAAQCLHYISSYRNIGEIITTAKDTISKELEPGMTTITTIHRSKGLEYSEVEVINDFAKPKAEEEYEDMIARVRESLKDSQLGNLLYVAVTRAKQKLVLDETIKDIIGA